jgi:hypothetical protein
MHRGLLAVALALLALTVGVHQGAARPLDALGTTQTLSDGSTVTVWDAYPTADPAPTPGSYVMAVSAAICTSGRPLPVNQRTTTDHFGLIVPPMLSGVPIPGFYGWDDTVVLPPQRCYSGWLAFEVPNGRTAIAVNYHERPCSRNPAFPAAAAY